MKSGFTGKEMSRKEREDYEQFQRTKQTYPGWETSLKETEDKYVERERELLEGKGRLGKAYGKVNWTEKENK